MQSGAYSDIDHELGRVETYKFEKSICTSIHMLQMPGKPKAGTVLVLQHPYWRFVQAP
jgi:hypothetical protein